jgi:hypothetical protein
MPVILATQEEEIRRMAVSNHLGQMVLKTLSQKKTHHKKRVDIGPEFKFRYHKNPPFAFSLYLG